MIPQQTLAPVALFVYSRPEHTLRALRSLKANDLALESELFIFADGPKMDATPDTLQKIKETRSVIRQEQWCGKVNIIESEQNKGLANSITSGVTQLCESHGQVIVLEDDLEISKGFLKYMNQGLQLYKGDTEVMHIAGYMYPVRIKLPDTFFVRAMFCWGWATWQRAWGQFVNDAVHLYNQLEQLGFPADYNIHSSNGFTATLKANVDGTLNTWAIRWLTTIYLQHGLCLVPGKSLVRNIGHDGSGLHSGINEKYLDQQIQDHVKVYPIEKKVNQLAFNSIKKYYAKQEYSLKNRVLRRVYNVIGKNY